MSFSPFDSAIYRDLLTDPEVSALFTDSAEVRAMLLFEGALARVQGELGVIPADSAGLIQRSSMEVQLDPSGLAAGTAKSGVSAPAMVEGFRKAMEAPEHARFVHWGATSQDVIDTALVLRLRQFLRIVESRLTELDEAFTVLARKNRDVVMAARTRGQIATPTTLGAKIAVWVAPLRRHLVRLEQLKPRLLCVSLAGASGNYAALGDDGPKVEAALAEALKLGVADVPWHSARDNMVELASLLALISGTLGKIGKDIAQLVQSEVAEISTGAGGASSTMPHKQNPVAAEVLQSLAMNNANLVSQMHQAMLHAQERDGAIWTLEWMALPQICIGTATALRHAQNLADNLKPNIAKMRANIDATNGLMMAEAAMFALSAHMPRPEAQALVKNLCSVSVAEGRHLKDVMAENSEVGVDWDAVFDPANYTGLAGQIVDRL